MDRQSRAKRKRSASAGTAQGSVLQNRPSHLPSDSINPLSHTPATLHQFAVAGLSETDELPSKSDSRFPHRAWHEPNSQRGQGRSRARSTGSKKQESESSDFETESETDQSGKSRNVEVKKGSKHLAQKAYVGPLLASIYGFLSNGDIDNAKRAFGYLMRSQAYGKQIDIRHNYYWALGAEIIMREGAKPSGHAGSSTRNQPFNDGNQESGPQRYPSANIPKVKAYFQDLIQRYPFNHKYKNSISALEFWPALLSYEIFQVHAQQNLELTQLGQEAEEWDDEMAGGMEPSSDMEEDFKYGDSRSGRLKQGKDAIRLRALDEMREIATRMDELLGNLPFSKSDELLRLRGMASLYIGDLLVPASVKSEEEREEAIARRETEKFVAWHNFKKVVDLGGPVDAAIQKFLDVDDKTEEEPAVPTFSSLPIREYRMKV